MEWNHFLPKSIFGEWSIGHWLTNRQHSIATALQTLAFKKNCLCGWHKKYLPDALLNLAWPFYCQRSRKTMTRTMSLRTLEQKSEAAREANSSRTFEERSKSNKKANASRTPETRKRIGKIAGQASAARPQQERKESARKGVEAKESETRKRIAKLANEAWLAQSTPEERSAIQKNNHQRKTPEERSEIIRRGWETKKTKLKQNNNDFSI